MQLGSATRWACELVARRGTGRGGCTCRSAAPGKARYYHPKATIPVRVVRKVPGTVGTAHTRPIHVECATPQCPVATRVWSFGVTSWRISVVAPSGPVSHRFPHIAAHVRRTVRAIAAGRVLAHRRCLPHGVSEIASTLIRWLVPPGVDAPIDSSRGLLPFCLSGQSASDPSSVGLGVIPTYAHDWLGRCSVPIIIPAAWFLAGSRLYALAILRIGHFSLVDPEGIQVDGVLGLFVALGAAVVVEDPSGTRRPVRRPSPCRRFRVPGPRPRWGSRAQALPMVSGSELSESARECLRCRDSN